MANNTDILAALNEIIDKINGITIQQVRCGGCGCGGGAGETEAPADSATEGSPPPAGFEDTTEPAQSPAYFDRKCNIANLLHDDLRTIINRFVELGLDDMTVIGAATAGTLIGAALGSASGPLLLASAVLGFTVGVVTALLLDPDLSGLVTLLDTHKAALICALYSASDSDAALTAYTDELTANGASGVQIGLINAVFGIRAINALFFNPVGTDGMLVQAALSGYTPSQPCDGCAQLFVWDYPTDVQGWQFVEGNTAGGTVNGEHDNGGALKNTIVKTSGNSVQGFWRYYPATAWIVGSGGYLKAWVHMDVSCSSATVIEIHYTDATSDRFDYGGSGSPVGDDVIQVNVSAGSVGKQIDYLEVEAGSGPSCASGTIVFLWDKIELKL